MLGRIKVKSLTVLMVAIKDKRYSCKSGSNFRFFSGYHSSVMHFSDVLVSDQSWIPVIAFIKIYMFMLNKLFESTCI